MQTGKEQEDDEKRVHLASVIYFILCVPSSTQSPQDEAHIHSYFFLNLFYSLRPVIHTESPQDEAHIHNYSIPSPNASHQKKIFLTSSLPQSVKFPV